MSPSPSVGVRRKKVRPQFARRFGVRRRRPRRHRPDGRRRASDQRQPQSDTEGRSESEIEDGRSEAAGRRQGSVVIKPGKDGKFRFFVRDEDDKSLMQSSTGYATEDEAKKMLDTVKAILAASKVTSEKAEGK